MSLQGRLRKWAHMCDVLDGQDEKLKTMLEDSQAVLKTARTSSQFTNHLQNAEEFFEKANKALEHIDKAFKTADGVCVDLRALRDINRAFTDLSEANVFERNPDKAVKALAVLFPAIGTIFANIPPGLKNMPGISWCAAILKGFGPDFWNAAYRPIQSVGMGSLGSQGFILRKDVPGNYY